ncbi:MAG: CapA family protein, partial [Aggregatilineales bacterium]
VIANRNRFDAISWQNIFLDELMPDVEGKYRIDAENRVIGGISRGGFWAYSIALQHPEMFKAIGGHSAFFDLYHAPPEFNPLDLILSVEEASTLELWLDRGVDDFAYEGLDIMHSRMNEAGLFHTYIIHPVGQHANNYWSEHTAEYFSFYVDALTKDTTSEIIIVSAATATPSNTTTTVNAFVTNTPQGTVSQPDSTIVSTPSPVPTTENLTPSQIEQMLFVPVVAFPSLQTTIPRSQIEALATGTYDEALIITPETLSVLNTLGININPQTRTVALTDLRNTLWRERTRYTLMPFDALTTEYRMLWMDDVPIVDQLDAYPFLVQSERANFDPAKLTRITLSGVTALTRESIPVIDANGLEWAASGIRDYVIRSDFFHISNEVSAYPGCPNLGAPDVLGGSSSFCSKPEHLALFELLDVDIIELTGNHNNDYGYQAYRDTLAFYESAGIQIIAGGETTDEAREPYRIEHNGNNIVMLACNAVGPYYALVNEDENLLGGVRPGATDCDWNWLDETLPQLATESDVLLMTVQHQEIEEYTPVDEARFDFYWLANLGADMVAGTSAHKPQTYEFLGTDDSRQAFIHHGMGNLYFDQPFWGNSRFFMNTLYIYEGQLLTVEVFPGIIDDLARPRLMTPEERENFLFFMFNQQNGF